MDTVNSSTLKYIPSKVDPYAHISAEPTYTCDTTIKCDTTIEMPPTTTSKRKEFLKRQK